MSEDIQTDEQTIEKLQEDIDAITNNWKRTLADFENFKRQKERENKELIEFAREVTVVKLLPTLDTLSQALKHLPLLKDGSLPEDPHQDRFAKDYKNWQIGISAILSQLDKTLGELGIKKIEAVGKKFDPHFHEAVKEVEGEEDGMVVNELQTGFELNDRVIRPSQVVVSKKVARNT